MTNFFQLLAVSEVGLVEPKNLNWIGQLLIKLFTGIGSVGLAVIIFTLIVKFIVLPLDIFSRVSSKKNEFTMKRIKPQLDKLKKQYANNPQLYQQKLSAIYKKEGYSMLGSCLPSLVSLIFFIVVWNAFRSYSYYQVAVTYNNVASSYNQVVQQQKEGTLSDEEIVSLAQDAAKETYEKETAGFFWIKNIWVADSALVKAVPSKTQFDSMTGQTVDETEYNQVMGKLNKTAVNGYFILPILCIGFSYLSTKIMQVVQKQQMEMQTVEGQPNMTKYMNIIMIVMMGFFALQYSSAFTLYMVISSVYTILSSLILNWSVTAVLKKKMEKVTEEKTVINR